MTLQRLLTPGTETSPFQKPPAGVAARGIHWVKPKLVAEVEFAAWTDDGILRHASFQGIREDKAPGEITREVATDKPEPCRCIQSAKRSERRG